MPKVLYKLTSHSNSPEKRVSIAVILSVPGIIAISFTTSSNGVILAIWLSSSRIFSKGVLLGPLLGPSVSVWVPPEVDLRKIFECK